jgi:hypothetical protein
MAYNTGDRGGAGASPPVRQSDALRAAADLIDLLGDRRVTVTSATGADAVSVQLHGDDAELYDGVLAALGHLDRGPRDVELHTCVVGDADVAGPPTHHVELVGDFRGQRVRLALVFRGPEAARIAAAHLARLCDGPAADGGT